MYFHLINLKSLISLSNFRMHQTQLCFSFLDAGTRFRLNDFLSRFHRYNRLEYLIFQVLSIPFQEAFEQSNRNLPREYAQYRLW